MKLKNKILNWLGLSWVATHVDEVINAVIEFKVQKATFQYYRNQLDIIIEARRKSKEAIEKGREDRRRKDTLVTGKVHELLSFLGLRHGSLLTAPPVVEPIINLTRLTDAVQDLAKKAKETNRITRKVADFVGYSEQEQCFGIPPNASSLGGCCATTATRPGYPHERISQLEKELHVARANQQTFVDAQNQLRDDINLLAAWMNVKLTTKPATSTPSQRVVESTAKKGKRS